MTALGLVVALAAPLFQGGSELHSGPALVPPALEVAAVGAELVLEQPLTVAAQSPELKAALEAFGGLWWRLTGTECGSVGDAGAAQLVVGLDGGLAEDEYRLAVAERIEVSGGSPSSVAHGLATVLQLARRGEREWSLPGVAIVDRPAFPFRSVMVDVGRQPHRAETLRGVIDLAYLYRLRYVQLHLTDDQRFEFPFEPVTGAAGTTIDRQGWVELVDYADARGIALIPEFDLPGHSGVLKRSGYLEDPTPDDGLTDADVAHPANRDRLLRIVDAMLEVFHTSPYFHIGGDESGAGASLVPFLAAVNGHLRSRPKPVRMLVWEGFHGAPSELPATGDDRVIVMAWESSYNPPWDLLEAGYEVVNASWKPLYIVGSGTPRMPHIGGRRWPARDIHAWRADEFWHWQAGTPVFEDRGPDDPHRDDGRWSVPERWRNQILGGQLLFWEQREWTVLPDGWERVAALSDRLWGGERAAAADYVGFTRRLDAVSERVRRLVQPARFELRGSFDRASPVTDDFHWYHGTATVAVQVDPALGGEVRLTRDGSAPTPESERYTGPFEFTGAGDLRARLFVDGVGIGAEARVRLDDRPARVRAAWYDLPRRALGQVPDFADRRSWTPFREGLLPELRGPYRTTEPVGQSMTGTLAVPEASAGDHVFRLQSRDGRAVLYVDGARVLGPSDPSEVKLSTTIALAAGPHSIRVDHASGPISPVVIVALQRPGADRFTNLSDELVEIPRGTEPLVLPSLAESVDLLAGNSLDAFRLVTGAAGLSIEDFAAVDGEGVLRLAGSPQGYLETRRWHRDYRLELEWRWPEGSRPGNSGVLVHASTPGLFYGWPRSLEVQLQNGRAGDFWTIGRDVDLTVEDAERRRRAERPGDLHSHRRIPRLVDDVELPPGEWNRLDVVCRGGEVVVSVNGVETQRGIDGSLREGAIGLQSEGAPIEFRSIRLEPLPLRPR